MPSKARSKTSSGKLTDDRPRPSLDDFDDQKALMISTTPSLSLDDCDNHKHEALTPRPGTRVEDRE